MKKFVLSLVSAMFAVFAAAAGEWTFSNNTITDGAWTLNVSGDGVTETTDYGGYGFAESCGELVSVKLNTPNLRNFGKWSFLECKKLDCPVSDYLNPNVTNIGERAFHYAKVNGDVVLNNIATVRARRTLSTVIRVMIRLV